MNINNLWLSAAKSPLQTTIIQASYHIHQNVAGVLKIMPRQMFVIIVSAFPGQDAGGREAQLAELRLQLRRKSLPSPVLNPCSSWGKTTSHTQMTEYVPTSWVLQEIWSKKTAAKSSVITEGDANLSVKEMYESTHFHPNWWTTDPHPGWPCWFNADGESVIFNPYFICL